MIDIFPSGLTNVLLYSRLAACSVWATFLVVPASLADTPYPQLSVLPGAATVTYSVVPISTWTLPQSPFLLTAARVIVLTHKSDQFLSALHA